MPHNCFHVSHLEFLALQRTYNEEYSERYFQDILMIGKRYASCGILLYYWNIVYVLVRGIQKWIKIKITKKRYKIASNWKMDQKVSLEKSCNQ